MESLRKKAEFSKTYRFGKTYRVSQLSIKTLKVTEPTFKLAVVVSKKISKKAVTRNKIRRRIREIIRKDIALDKSGYFVIVNIHNNLSQTPHPELKAILIQSFKKVLQ